MTAPGVGPITALCFLATIDDPTRFKTIEKRRSLSRIDDPTIRIRRDRLDRPNLEVRRRHAAELSLRGSQRNAHPRGKMVERSKLGDPGLRSEPGCAKPRLPSLESLLSFCTECGSTAPNSNGQRRPPISLRSRTTGSRDTAGKQRPCRDAGVGEIAPGFAMLREQTALHTLIRQRHLTPSCGGHVPCTLRAA